jgi:hypothetical protein
MLPTIWGTYMKLVTKYQISAINSCWEKCDEKLAYMFNVYKNQLSRQTGSRNLTDPKTLPTIWGTYMKLVTKYQISAINSCWEKCDEKLAYMFNILYNHFRWSGCCCFCRFWLHLAIQTDQKPFNSYSCSNLWMGKSAITWT